MSDPASKSASDFDFIVRVLRRRGLLILMCCLLAGASALAFSVAQHKKYTSTAQLLFRDPGLDQKLFGSTFFEPSTNPDREAATNVQLVSLGEISILTSRALHRQLTGPQIRSRIEVKAQGRSDVVAIRATDSDPNLAARLANTFAQQFIAFRVRADRLKIDQALRLVLNQLADRTTKRSAFEIRGLESRAEQLRLLSSLQTGNAELVQPATVSHGASSPRPKRNTVFGLILGLLLGVGLAVLLERLDRRITDISEFETLFGLPVLAAIPESVALAGKADLADLPFGDAEAFRMLRARLRYFNVDRPIRSILIASPAPSDGKSTIAWYLASTAAATGAGRVLLIDADLRRASISGDTSLNPVPGLAELVSRDISLSEVIQPVPVRASSEEDEGHASLDVIVAGAKAPNPVELLESQRMSDLLKEFESRYDLVIIDTPPTSVVSDAIPLLGQVTGVLVVSRLGSTTEGAATHLRGHLEGLGAHPLGVVANGLSPRRGDGGYGGYGYGYSYGYADRESDARPSLADSDPRSSRDADPYGDRELDLIRAADAVAARERDR